MNGPPRSRPLRWRRPAALAAALLLAVPAGAQDRSDTGRRRPEPPARPDQESPQDPQQAPAATWCFGGGPAWMGGGTLFRLETVTGAAIPWGPAGQVLFTSSRFRTRLDTDPGIALHGGRRLGRHWSVRLDLGYHRLDVAAEALQGQSAGVFRFDRLGVATVGLGVEARLASARSYPVFTAGAVLARLSAQRESGLDQTSAGLRVGLGYVATIGDRVALRVDSRLARVGFALDDAYLPQVATGPLPAVELDVASSLNFFEIMIGVSWTR